jgi:DNA-binding NarL/FixJ family response regulator
VSQLARTITTILVDDHTLFRDGIRELLSTEPDIEVVAEGRSGQDAITLTAQHQPDVVLLDVEMPGPPPQEVIPHIHAICPKSRVVIVTMYADPELAHELMTIGARAYLVKDVSCEQLFGAIRTVMHDDVRTLLASARANLDRLARASLADKPMLSAREQAVLELAARAMTNAQIGSTLFIAEGTVRRHLSNAYRKLGASGRLAAVNQAIATGLIRPAGTRFHPPLPRLHLAPSRDAIGDPGSDSRSGR